jgi:divalent metal cation (Fe/Co/Zn/Cd) transporter
MRGSPSITALGATIATVGAVLSGSLLAWIAAAVCWLIAACVAWRAGNGGDDA